MQRFYTPKTGSNKSTDSLPSSVPELHMIVGFGVLEDDSWISLEPQYDYKGDVFVAKEDWWNVRSAAPSPSKSSLKVSSP